MTVNELIGKLAPWEEPVIREPTYFFKVVQPLVGDIRAALERQAETITAFTDIIKSRDTEIDNLKSRLEVYAGESKRLLALVGSK